VLKTRRLGYDGRGQRVIRSPRNWAVHSMPVGGVPLILEEFIPFEREVSILGVPAAAAARPPTTRSPRTDTWTASSGYHWPLSGQETAEARGESHAPAAQSHFDYAGVLTIEFFVKQGRLIANETAPRVITPDIWTSRAR